MMYKGILIILLILVSGTSIFAFGNELCSDALKSLVETNEVSRDKLHKFMQLQGDLTLHKLTYSLYRNEVSKERFKIEDQILELTKQLDSQDPEFKKIKDSFESNPLARHHLASIMPFLKNIINNQINEEDPVKRKLFMIGMNDLKLLSVITEGEFKTRSGRYDSRFTKSHADSRSILNLLRIINEGVKKSDVSMEKARKHAKERMQDVQNEMVKLIGSMRLPRECQKIYNTCKLNYENSSMIDEGFLNIMLEVADQAAGFHRTHFLSYGSVNLDFNRKTNNNNNNNNSDKTKKKEDNSRVLPAIINDKTDAQIVNDYLIQHVLDHLPYFVTREDLEKDQELLYALARMIDAGTLAKKDREERIFVYKGDSYYLPELWNDSYKDNRLVKRFKDRFVRFYAEPILDIFNDDEHEFKIPDDIPKDQRNDFERVRNEQEYMFGHKLSFEFKGKLYDIHTGKLIEPNLQGLLQYKKGFVKNSGGEDYTASADLDARKAKAVKNNERSYIMDDEVYHISGQPVDINKEYERYKVKFNHDNMSVNSDAKKKQFPTKQQILDLEQVEPQKYALVIKALADKKRSYSFNGEVYDLYSEKPFDPIAKDQVLVVHNEYRKKSGLQPVADTDAENVKAILNDDLTYEKEGEYFHTLSGRKISSRTNVVEVDKGFYEHDQIFTNELMINDLSNEEILKNYFQTPNAKECDYHTVIDKASGLLKVYSTEPKVVYSTEVLVGQEGDSFKGSSTPAGMLFSNLTRDSQKSYVPSFDLKGLEAFEIDKTVALNNQNPNDNRNTNGAVKLPKQQLSYFKNNYYDAECPFYVLPDSDDLKYQMRDGKLEFVIKDGEAFKCEKGGKCKGDYHLSKSNKFAAQEIKVNFEELGLENGVSKKYVETLVEKKAELMKKLGLSNGEYNELVKLAVAVLGVESGFGTEKAYLFKEGLPQGQMLVSFIKFSDRMDNAFGDLFWDGENNFGDVFDFSCKNQNSRGLTQIKCVDEFLKDEYPDITPSSLNKPENAAIATMFVLNQKYKQLEALKSMHPAINEVNKFDYLYYIYSGSVHRIQSKNATPVINPKSKELMNYASKIKVLTK